MPTDNRELFSDSAAPRDVIEPAGLTRDMLATLNAAVGKPFTVHEPGDALLDADGTAIAIGPTVRHPGVLGGVTITQREADTLGYTPAEFPNIKVIPDPTRKDHSND